MDAATSAEPFEARMPTISGENIAAAAARKSAAGSPPPGIPSLAAASRYAHRRLPRLPVRRLSSAPHLRTPPRASPNAERLRTMQPSHELLAFYRQKIQEFDGEHADMLQKLERYKGTFGDQVSPAQPSPAARTLSPPPPGPALRYAGRRECAPSRGRTSC